MARTSCTSGYAGDKGAGDVTALGLRPTSALAGKEMVPTTVGRNSLERQAARVRWRWHVAELNPSSRVGRHRLSAETCRTGREGYRKLPEDKVWRDR